MLLLTAAIALKAWAGATITVMPPEDDLRAGTVCPAAVLSDSGRGDDLVVDSDKYVGGSMHEQAVLLERNCIQGGFPEGKIEGWPEEDIA